MSDHLSGALGAVDWNKNAADFLGDVDQSTRLSQCVERLALWSFELQKADPDGAALAFVREMQASALSVTATIALGLYKAGAGGMRSVVESALYYSYFRHHPVELATLTRDDRYHLSRWDIIEYHKKHTKDYLKKQEPFGFIGNLETWYSKISAIVHGQIPGVWSSTDLAMTKYNADLLKECVQEFERATHLTGILFMITCSSENWGSFSPAAKSIFIKGFTGPQKEILGLSKQ